MDKFSETNNAAALQQLVAENAALLDAKVTAEKAAATVSSQVRFFAVSLSSSGPSLILRS